MALLDLATLEGWIQEFRDAGHPLAGTIRVLPQDGEQGDDTGLVCVGLSSVSTVLYIQPAEIDAPDWCVTFEPRHESQSVDSATVRALADELAAVAALCVFLEAKARAHPRDAA